MKLEIQSIHFTADQKLEDYIQEKVDKLETFYDRFLNGEVYLKLDKDDKKENKIAEIKLFVPGGSFFVKEQADSFEKAVNAGTAALERQVKRFKEKANSH